MTTTEHVCPVCGKTEFRYANSHDICEICDWEDEEIAERFPDEKWGANDISLNQYRAEYKKKSVLKTA